MKYQILQGDNRQTLKTIADNSVDAIVTDPPYGIDFLGKAWDANTGALETYQECLRVLKPGGHILAFSAARTYHHLAVTLEQAGFEIRDQIMWIYSSGFPKSQDIGKSIERSAGKKKGRLGPLYTPAQGNPKITACEICGAGNGVLKASKCQQDPCPFKEIARPADNEWAGWGTALKPAHEPIALARKPIKLSIAKNCQQYGVGALNIDATRIEWAPGELEKEQAWREKYSSKNTGGPTFSENDIDLQRKSITDTSVKDAPLQGRFPSNVLGEIPDYQKYFYCPKVSRRERHIGFDTTDIPTNPDGMWDDGVQFQEKKQCVETLKESLTSIGGYWCDEQGNKIDCESADGKLAYVPGAGVILVHGVKHEVEKYRKANNIVGANVGNNHPTVKPIELMKYLIKLITPPGGIVLDPFNGSGSTGCAAVELGFEYIGCELDPAYVAIANKRIAAWNKQDTTFEELFE